MSDEAKCDCQRCGEHLCFPLEMAGLAIECPHCKCETVLFIPPAESNRIVNCPCQHCSGAIEFDANALSQDNSLVQCPHCGLETHLFIPQEGKQPVTSPSATKPGLEVWNDKSRPAAERIAAYKAHIRATRGEREAKLKELQENLNRLENNITIYSNQDTLKFDGGSIKIQKRGWANALSSGMNGERTIQVSSLTAVQMKPGTMMTPGYIIFAYPGSTPFTGGVFDAVQDPDAFFFSRDLNGRVAEFKAAVEKKMRESKQPAPVHHAPVTLTEELRKLAELKNQGVLSQAEFEAAKRKLLG